MIPERLSDEELVERLLTEKNRRSPELERRLEHSQRGGRRQAPFLGPTEVDMQILAGCARFCRHHEAELRVAGRTNQYWTALPPARAVTTQFEIHVGRCAARGRKVQGRHRLPTWDAKELSTVGRGSLLVATAAHMILEVPE